VKHLEDILVYMIYSTADKFRWISDRFIS